jgi:hypothetical protein
MNLVHRGTIYPNTRAVSRGEFAGWLS